LIWSTFVWWDLGGRNIKKDCRSSCKFAKNNWIKRIVGVKGTSKRRVDKLGVEAGAKDNVKM